MIAFNPLAEFYKRNWFNELVPRMFYQNSTSFFELDINVISILRSLAGSTTSKGIEGSGKHGSSVFPARIAHGRFNLKKIIVTIIIL
ncbi:predicted protein [Botrytis cinerea T4]|uniref:Uncharacterized protein n=1 Tax=Botryotinia fuckeliana (strain T4) TaxID=999810 RepID=G2YWS0_BOTF4|nr:predicted protein [Botrytis cinerea T4]